MKDTQQTILEVLKHIQKRPNMWVASDLPAIVNFLNGFKIALSATGYELPETVHAEIAEMRGWEGASVPLYRQMEAQGMDETAIIEELVTIWIMGIERISSETEQVINKD